VIMAKKARMKNLKPLWSNGQAAAPPPRPEPATSRTPPRFSTYLSRELRRRLKIRAAESDRPVWELVTEAVETYLIDKNG